MQKVGDTGDISLQFFLASAKFWAIMGNFGSFFGHFFVLIFFGQKCISAIFITFCISASLRFSPLIRSHLQVVEGTSTGTLARMVNQPGGILAGVAKKVNTTLFSCFDIVMSLCLIV